MWLIIIFLAGTVGLITPAMAQLYRWVDEQGQIHISDKLPLHTKEFKIYQGRQSPGEAGASPEPARSDRVGATSGSVDLNKPPPHRVRELRVDALLNRRLSVPLILDTGASYTFLTKQTAQDLRLPITRDTPRLKFRTPAGEILQPVTRLRSIRIGTAEVQDVDVAVDMDGRLQIGLLGMTFLRHFKVTVDQERGLVRFDRYR